MYELVYKQGVCVCVHVPVFAGVGSVVLAGRGRAVAVCAPVVSHLVGQRTSSAAAHTPNTHTHRIEVVEGSSCTHQSRHVKQHNK